MFDFEFLFSSLFKKKPKPLSPLIWKVQKTFGKGAKIMIWEKADGVYIRMAGNVDRGEIFSHEWIKILSND